MEVKDSVIQRFRDMRTEKLRKLKAYHLKYAQIIADVLKERKGEGKDNG